MAGAPGPRAGALLRATCVLCRAAHPRALCVLDGPFAARGSASASHPPSRKVSAPSEGLLRSNFTDRSEIQRGTRAKGRGKRGASPAALGRPPVEAGAGAGDRTERERMFVRVHQQHRAVYQGRTARERQRAKRRWADRVGR